MKNLLKNTFIPLSLAGFIGAAPVLSIQSHFTDAANASDLKKPRTIHTLETAINSLAKREGISANWLRHWVNQESGTGQTRFEPHVYKQRSKIDSHLPEIDRRAMASSHGPLQVMGYNAEFCGLNWRDLYDPFHGIECGLKHLKQWVKRHPKDANRLFNGLASYNGGYGGPERDASREYASKVLTISPH